MLDKLSEKCVLSWGWSRAIWLIGAGAASSLALPPIGFFPILFITFSILIWCMDGIAQPHFFKAFKRLGQSFFVGWCFGFGYFCSSLFWIGEAFLVEAETFAWALPLAVFGLPAFLALFWGVATGLASFFWLSGVARILSLAMAISFTELLRSIILTGFPWNLPGYVLTSSIWSMQIAWLIDIHMLTFLTIVIFSTLVLSVQKSRKSFFQQNLGIIISLIIIGLIHLYGFIRLQDADTISDSSVRIRIVHAGINQSEKFISGNQDKILQRYFDLSDYPASDQFSSIDSVTHLIWSESAFPFLLSQNPDVVGKIADLLPEHTTLITGAARQVDGVNGEQIHNSIYVISGNGVIQDAYDKIKLVPFGEFLPYQDTLESLGFEQLTRQRGGFAQGLRSKTLTTKQAPPFIPLICFEAIFPDLSDRSRHEDSPKWIVNVTNDSWFGQLLGPYQHFHHARLRAVEQGLPLVRSANMGISAIIDSYGRIVAEKGVNDIGVVDGYLPQALQLAPVRNLRNKWLIMIFVLCTIFILYNRLTLKY